jgi:hypothetical protein
MFGNKDNKSKQEPELDIKIVTMPGDFYAGANPTVKFREVEKTIDVVKAGGATLTGHEKKALDKATAKGGFLTGWKLWVIGGIVLFTLFAAGAGLYYWWQGRSQAPFTPPPLPPITVPTPPVPTPPVEPVATTTPTTTPEVVPPVKESIIEFPSKLLAESVDMDSDKITDASEEIFGTDQGNLDTDGDSYSDGHELFYLYNPNGVEPQKLIDSGTVKKFTSGNFGYELYYPVRWIEGAVDTDGRQVLFSTLTGENIEVRVFDLNLGQTFADWFSAIAPMDENLSDYSDFTSRFGAAGKMRAGGLVYFIYTDMLVYALVYHTTDSAVVNYKNVLEVMSRSFLINGPASAETPAMIPETPLPEVSATPTLPIATSTQESPAETPTGTGQAEMPAL